MGNAAYEERRRLERERKLFDERRYDDRQRREALANEVVELALNAIKAFLTGKAAFVATWAHQGTDGVVVSFEMPPAPSSGGEVKEG